MPPLPSATILLPMAGDAGQALARRLLEHRDALFGYILALVRSWPIAEELFQEVSLVVLQKGQQGEAVDQFLPWSREIARRMVLDSWKRSARSRVVLSEAALDAVDRAFLERDDEPASSDLVRALRRCLEKLPDHLRRLVDLRYSESLPLQEIARRLERSAGSVQVALSRVRMRLHDCAKRAGGEASPA